MLFWKNPPTWITFGNWFQKGIPKNHNKEEKEETNLLEAEERKRERERRAVKNPLLPDQTFCYDKLKTLGLIRYKNYKMFDFVCKE